jgi:hypothetical protein
MTLTPQQAKDLAEQLLHDPDTAPGVAGADRIPETIAGYRIRRRIASGGMGTVYEAEQQRPHRRVALKVMKAGIASRSALRRFEYEAEILGRLRHPGIAQVFEAGTHDDASGGAPFFAMEFVPNASNLIEYANANGLALRERLDLFARVCDAVHHGHQKGVIHRDLKPANILVDDAGQPKVIDFGVALATDSDIAVTTIQTRVGDLLGTLQYMSPEQCEANPDQLDVRTDVYSLGIVLYELLCGQPPYDVSGTPLPKATRIIQEQVPPPPGAVRRACRGDVEAIALKALEKAPDRRYQSADHLARDIRRYLKGQPTEARAPRPWMRVVHWIGRHPVLATGAVCAGIAGLSIVLTMGSVWWLRSRPHHIVTMADGREARLVSVAGRTLHTWKSAGPGRISFAELVDRPAAFGGGRMALIGYEWDAHVERDGSLCAFRPGDPETPIWIARLTEDDIRDSPLRVGYAASQFGVTAAQIMDVFPARAGAEVVVIFKSGSSPVSLCVHDLGGQRLYRIWHDGSISPPYWLAAEQTLVVSGLSHEKPWAQDYFRVAERQPIVVFGLKPRVGHLARGWTGVSTGADDPTLAWYKCIVPATLSSIYGGANLIPPHPDEDASRYVRLDVDLRDDRDCTVSWLMTGSGMLLPESAAPTDRYKLRMQQGQAPPPQHLKLVDAPPPPEELE